MSLNNKITLLILTSELGGKMESNTITWWIYALLSAGFAALTTIFAKIGVEKLK
ncbi:hypothetical protein [Nostoc sp.]|uniref:hypothetical protein n=1 Tax=Nostoc sp. TaxID=1180 RepID=UPI002FF95917